MPKVRLSNGSVVSLPGEVFLDASFLVDVFYGGLDERQKRKHESAKRLMGQLIVLAKQAELTVFCSGLVFQELWFVLGREMFLRDNPGRDWGRLDKRDKRRVFARYGRDLETVTERLLKLPIDLVDAWQEDRCIPQVVSLMRGQPLMPADACHVVTMRENDVAAIVTGDRDFAGLTGIQAVFYC